MKRTKTRSVILLVCLLAFFWGMLARYGVGVYNDSDQYIRMHIHREPLYPLFLAFCRLISGENALLTAAILQNLLAAVSIWVTVEYFAKTFGLRLWEELLVTAVELAPHLLTMFFSSLHLFMTNSVMSEAVCLPLFTLFVMECAKILLGGGSRPVWRRGSTWAALALALLISLTRGQLMTSILVWAVVMGIEAVRRGRTIKGGLTALLFAVAAITALTFGARTLLVKSYNLVFNGRFINNTYGTVNTLTNVLYASDREDGQNIEDEEARAFFYRMYDEADRRQATWRYAGSSWTERTEHIEKWHDTVKFEIIEDIFYHTYDSTVTSDYITQNLMADETAGKIIAGLLPECFPRWLGNYLLIARYGLIRSIAVVHPLVNWAVLLLYAAAVGLTVRRLFKEPGSRAARVMILALLAVAANVSATSLTIMCLSRYMIYGFALFYVGLYLLVREEALA